MRRLIGRCLYQPMTKWEKVPGVIIVKESPNECDEYVFVWREKGRKHESHIMFGCKRHWDGSY